MDYVSYAKWLQPSLGRQLTQMYVEAAQAFEAFLRAQRQGRAIEEVTIQDIQAYERIFDPESEESRCPYPRLSLLYQYLSNEEMARAILRRGAENPAPVPLNTFRGIKPEYQNRLKAMGIVTNLDLLLRAKTQKDREKLARKARIPLEVLLEIVKLADLRRLIAVTHIPTLVSAGFDTIFKIAQADPEELCSKVREHLARAGSQVESQIANYTSLIPRAKLYPALVEGL